MLASTGEEVGWRGLALPALQAGVGPVRASVIPGLVTATWHVPYWVLQGILDDYGPWYLAIDYVFVLALTFQLPWLVLVVSSWGNRSRPHSCDVRARG